MTEVIRTWKQLSAISGKKRTALVMASKRGKLPLTEAWDRGVRVFDRQEVEAWLQATNHKDVRIDQC